MAFAVTAGWCTGAAAQSLDEQIDTLARPLAGDQVFYRWQSTVSGENLARLGTLNAVTNKHFMSVKDGVSAGQGLYVAGTPSSSASYLPVEGGNLLEVRIDKGTRLVDLTDDATLKRLAELNLSSYKLQHAADLQEHVLIKYQDDWYVGKNLTNRAHFEIYPNPRRTNDEIVAHYRSIEEGPSQKQVLQQVGAKSPAQLSEILRRPDTIDMALRVVPSAAAPELLRRHFTRIVAPRAGLAVWGQVMEDPTLYATVRADPTLRARLVQDATFLMREHERYLMPVSREQTPFFEVLLDETGLKDHERAFVRKSLINTHLADASLRESPELLAQLTRPLFDGLVLNPLEREKIHAQTSRILAELEATITNPAGLTDLLRHAGIDDPDFRARADHLTTRAQAIDHAIIERSRPTLRAALSQARTLREIVGTMDRLANALPVVQVDDALIDFVRFHGREYRALMQSSSDLQLGVTLAQQKRSELLQTQTYRSALAASPAARGEYVAHCLDSPGCAQNLAIRITSDRGAILKDVTDFTEVVRALERGPPPRDRLYAALLDHAPPEALLKAIGEEVHPDGLSAKVRALIFDRVRALGPRGLRTRSLVGLRFLAGDDPITARDLMRAAIAAAVHPDDLADVGTILSTDRKANMALSTAFSRRLTELGPSESDLLHVRGLKLAGALPPPARTRECLNELARLVMP